MDDQFHSEYIEAYKGYLIAKNSDGGFRIDLPSGYTILPNADTLQECYDFIADHLEKSY